MYLHFIIANFCLEIVWKIFLCLFSLILCAGACTSDEVASPPGLHEGDGYRTRSSFIRLTRGSVRLSSLKDHLIHLCSWEPQILEYARIISNEAEKKSSGSFQTTWVVKCIMYFFASQERRRVVVFFFNLFLLKRKILERERRRDREGSFPKAELI